MIANIPLVGRDPGFAGKGARLFVVAAVVGRDGEAVGLEGFAYGAANSASAAGYDRDACHRVSFRLSF